MGKQKNLDYHIHSMTIDDYPEVYQLWADSDGITLRSSDSRPSIEKYLARNPGLSLVARNEIGTLIAAVLCGHDGARGYIRHLAVEMKFRGQNIGHRMVEECLSRLQTAGIEKCTIFVRSDNAEGLRFWEKTGWEKRNDLLAMSKQIP